MTKNFYFFIGTEAELIKLFPVIKIFMEKKVPFKIISSGQNSITENPLLKELKLKVSIRLSDDNRKENVREYFLWFIKTFSVNFSKLKKEFQQTQNSKTFLIIHGDTLSTVMGALYGKIFGLKVVHIEAGLRSFDLFNPFPEEIDRIVASKLTDIHFAPNKWAFGNLKSERKINIEQNTLLETFQYFSRKKIKLAESKGKYFILVCHRQENMMNKEKTISLLKEILRLTKQFNCVFVMHAPTKKMLEERGLLKKLERSRNILFVDRLYYPKFIRVLANAEFFITDGGSNQEEAYYLGKPCLILRQRTERIEGLGKNVVLSKMNREVISEFVKNYEKYKRQPLKTNTSPSRIILNYLLKA